MMGRLDWSQRQLFYAFDLDAAVPLAVRMSSPPLATPDLPRYPGQPGLPLVLRLRPGGCDPQPLRRLARQHTPCRKIPCDLHENGRDLARSPARTLRRSSSHAREPNQERPVTPRAPCAGRGAVTTTHRWKASFTRPKSRSFISGAGRPGTRRAAISSPADPLGARVSHARAGRTSDGQLTASTKDPMGRRMAEHR
jgi:hypothetical protein